MKVLCTCESKKIMHTQDPIIRVFPKIGHSANVGIIVLDSLLI